MGTQSIKTTAYGEIKGFDNWKKVSGMKLSLIVDNQGWLLAEGLGPANEQDKKVICPVIEELSNNRITFPRLNIFLADGNYKVWQIYA